LPACKKSSGTFSRHESLRLSRVLRTRHVIPDVRRLIMKKPRGAARDPRAELAGRVKSPSWTFHSQENLRFSRVLRTRHVIPDMRRLKMENREGLPVPREQSWLAVGKVLPELFPGRKTSGFRGCCAPGTSSMTCSRLFVHSLLARLAAAADGLALRLRRRLGGGRLGGDHRGRLAARATPLRRRG
jgi:hypothetical protein